MSPWATFYEGREGTSYLDYVKQRYAPYVEAIRNRLDEDDLVLELGTGTGTITKAIVDRLGVDASCMRFAATDIDPEMVDIAKCRLNADDVSVYREDAIGTMFPTRGDIVHSHGMLEHFDDATIRLVIDNYRHARAQVHYVPGLYAAPTFGDERLMSVDAWWKICKPSQIITFNDGLDYALVFE
jgi:SAM-dependent methyltransferase